MRIVGPLIVLALLGASDIYVRSRVDPGNPDSHCFWWPAGTVTFHQSSTGNIPGAINQNTNGSEFGAVTRAWQSWQAITTSCSNLSLTEGAQVSDRTVGYDASHPSANQNVILFRERQCTSVVDASDSCWPDSCGNTYDCWEYSQGTIALTTSTFDKNTGRLFDSDVEFDAANFFFTTDDGSPCPQSGPYSQSCVAYDVQNTMTHEAGHFLGLDHTNYLGSVMNPTAPLGETSKRTIDSGSHTFVCDTYPRGKASKDCVAPAEKTGGCNSSQGPLMTAGALLLLGMLRRRRV